MDAINNLNEKLMTVEKGLKQAEDILIELDAKVKIQTEENISLEEKLRMLTNRVNKDQETALSQEAYLYEIKMKTEVLTHRQDIQRKTLQQIINKLRIICENFEMESHRIRSKIDHESNSIITNKFWLTDKAVSDEIKELAEERKELIGIREILWYAEEEKISSSLEQESVEYENLEISKSFYTTEDAIYLPETADYSLMNIQKVQHREQANEQTKESKLEAFSNVQSSTIPWFHELRKRRPDSSQQIDY